ncbi:putative zw10 centromere kinetochore protein zw10 [Erysiphe neolycopersici]|uniref:Putative zw10 centromere kinetochore protein zw10 n=1 Tax=Erysiphe neolycopersici TaxID=212602 RepID=A0A420HNV7_9PEZI|nr:putative zw10 centromere kinetochore protein zw10 [Erysiphe neolycopersici]
MSTLDGQTQLGQALVDFSTQATFPHDESRISIQLNPSAYYGTLSALTAAKVKIETEIRSISREIADEVDDWIAHTDAIQKDINQCHKLANSIVRDAEADQQRLVEIKEKELHLIALQKEYSFNEDILIFYREIMKLYHEILHVEKSIAAKDFLDGLVKLEDIYKSNQHIFDYHSIQVMRQLELKSSDFRKIIREQLLNLWKALLNVDIKQKTITIHWSIPSKNERNGLKDVVLGLAMFGDLKDLTKKLCNDLDTIILKARMTLKAEKLPSIQITGCTISLGPMVDNFIKVLFLDIKKLIQFLSRALPVELYQPLSESLMLILSDRILREWLDHRVPISVCDVIDYQKILTEVAESIADIESVGWLGFDGIRDWIENFPKIWLNKRRDTALDQVREQILMRIETPIKKEKVEARAYEDDHSGRANPVFVTERQDWDAAWDFDEDNSTQRSEIKDHDLDIKTKSNHISDESTHKDLSDFEDDIVDAWGWGDESAQENTINKDIKIEGHIVSDENNLCNSSLHENPTVEEDTLIFEEYWISELPKSIKAKVLEIYEDCATLTNLGLLTLPTQILAMYRAISLSYYVRHDCGNLYCYNDSIWLAEKLREYTRDWKHRSDISSQFQRVDKSETDIALLENFGKRAIENEKSDQVATISNLLDDTRNLFRQDDSKKIYIDNRISSALLHIRKRSMLWKDILKFSTRASITGAMINTMAEKIISDVFNLGDISVEDAERIATIISEVETLDNLFIPGFNGDPENEILGESKIPLTVQYSEKWMKMKFLSEVLQSNLKDVKFLWFESDLSLYFSVEETVELIRLSFVMNAVVRQTIKEIRDNPKPKVDDDS